MGGHAFEVRLVNDPIFDGALGAAGRRRGVVVDDNGASEGRFGPGETRLARVRRPDGREGLGIRVEEHALRVEAAAMRRIVLAIRAVAVALTGTDAGNKGAPDVT